MLNIRRLIIKDLKESYKLNRRPARSRRMTENWMLEDDVPFKVQELFNYLSDEEALPFEKVRAELKGAKLSESEISEIIRSVFRQEGKGGLIASNIKGTVYIGSEETLDDLKAEHTETEKDLRLANRLEYGTGETGKPGRSDSFVREFLESLSVEDMKAFKNNISSLKVTIPEGNKRAERVAKYLFGEQVDKIKTTSATTWSIAGTITFKRIADVPDEIKERLSSNGTLSNIQAVVYLVKEQGMRLS